MLLPQKIIALPTLPAFVSSVKKTTYGRNHITRQKTYNLRTQRYCDVELDCENNYSRVHNKVPA